MAPEIVRAHKAELHALPADLRPDADPALADRLLILTEGATTVATLTPGPEPAHHAREIAELLLEM
ncbi:hypothetical protein [Streptomyces virginiae]